MFQYFSISSFVLCVGLQGYRAAGGLDVELPPQNYSVAKILKTARLQGPVLGCQNQPTTGYVRRYLQSMSLSYPLSKTIRVSHDFGTARKISFQSKPLFTRNIRGRNQNSALGVSASLLIGRCLRQWSSLLFECWAAPKLCHRLVWHQARVRACPRPFHARALAIIKDILRRYLVQIGYSSV